jgi:folate-binding protein YgfZ
VNLEELTDWKALGFYGPDAASIRDVGFGLSEHESAEVENNGTKLLAVGVATPVPGFDHLGPADMVGVVRERLIERGAIPASVDVYETARIKAGIPRFGSDITPENFPAETGILERAVSFEKGCYPGQETVARMRYRGHPNKLLHRFAVEGPSPPPDTPILQAGKQVGRATSVAPLPVDGETFALGYLSRDANARGVLRAGNATLLPLA